MDKLATNDNEVLYLNQLSTKEKNKCEMSRSNLKWKEGSAPVGKSVTCSELPSTFIRTNSHTNLETDSIFFNDKGLKVKVMRLTESSLPTEAKPWQTHTLPSTASDSKNIKVRKVKSIYTQNKNISQKQEDKENNVIAVTGKEQAGDCLEERLVSEVHVKSCDKEKNNIALESDLQYTCGRLEKTVNKSSKEEQKIPYSGKRKKVEGMSGNKIHRPPKKKGSSPEKNESSYKTCVKKYDTKEMKAYIQTKRSERKHQYYEEVRKKEAILELQKKNLEKLRETASKVLMKSSKTLEESKPRWQGPLEDDISETNPPAIHIFETKMSQSKKPKLHKKCENSKQVINELGVEEHIGEGSIGDTNDSLVNKMLQNSIEMESGNINQNRDCKRPTKLRLTQNRPSADDTKIISAMEQEYKLLTAEPKIHPEEKQSKRPVDCSRSLIEEQDESHVGGSRNVLPVEQDKFDGGGQLATEQKNKIFVDSAEHMLSAEGQKMFDADDSRDLLAKERQDSVCVEKPRDILAIKQQNKFHVEGSQNLSKIEQENTCPDDESRVSSMRQQNNLLKHDLRGFSAAAQQIRSNAVIPIAIDSDKKRETYHFSHKADLQNESLYNDLQPLSAERYDEARGPSIHKESMKDALKKVQQQMLTKDKERNPEWLSTFVKTDAFNMMNIIKMKRISCQKKYPESGVSNEVKKEVVPPRRPGDDDKTDAFNMMNIIKMKRLSCQNNNSESGMRKKAKQEIVGTQNSVNDETDASSIVSMEEDFKVRPEPLRLSEICLPETHKPVTISGSSRPSGHSSEPAEETITSTKWSFASEAPPLEVPESVRQIKLKSISNDSSDRSLPTTNKERPKLQPLLSDDRIEIGQVQATSSERVYSNSQSCSSNSSFQPMDEVGSIPGTTVEVPQEVLQMQRPSSQHSLSLSTPYPGNIQLYNILIEDALFQKEQCELMYRTQEEVLEVNYKSTLAEIDFKIRSYQTTAMDSISSDKEAEAKSKIETFYRRARANIRRRKNHAIWNCVKRIDDLQKAKDLLEKQVKMKRFKLRSAESSPKKLVAVRSSSATSVGENSSSSDSTQQFDDKKRHEHDAVLVLKQKKEKKMLKKLYEDEKIKMQEIERTLKSSRSRRDKSTSPLQSMKEAATRDVACSAHIYHPTSSSVQSVEEARGTDMYNSESFESPESSETPRQPRMMSRMLVPSKPFIAARFNSKSKMLIKVPLSPRMQLCSKRRVSSGSDESLLFSQNETQSEQSDYEVKISALKEQKRQRLMILNRLHRELKKAQKELLKATEASLIKQIQVYDSYIDETKKQLAEVTEEVSAKKVVRPQIKHPRVSDKFLPRSVEGSPKPPIETDTHTMSITETARSSAQITEHSLSKVELNNGVLETPSVVHKGSNVSDEEVITALSSQALQDGDILYSEECTINRSESKVSEIVSSITSQASNDLNEVSESAECQTIKSGSKMSDPHDILYSEGCTINRTESKASETVSSIASQASNDLNEVSESAECQTINSGSKMSDPHSSAVSEVSNVVSNVSHSAQSTIVKSNNKMSDLQSNVVSEASNILAIVSHSAHSTVVKSDSKLSHPLSSAVLEASNDSDNVSYSAQPMTVKSDSKMTTDPLSSVVSGASNGLDNVVQSEEWRTVQSEKYECDPINTVSSEVSILKMENTTNDTLCKTLQTGIKSSESRSPVASNLQKVELSLSIPQHLDSSSSKVQIIQTSGASNISCTDFSNCSVISELMEVNSNSEGTSVEDESQWMDAKEFFDQEEEELDNVSFSNLKDIKVSVRSVSKSSRCRSRSQSASSVSKEQMPERDGTDTRPSISEYSGAEDILDKTTPKKNFSNKKSLTLSTSDNLDVGSVVSIISQAPSSKTPKTPESYVNIDDADCTIFDAVSEKSVTDVFSNTNSDQSILDKSEQSNNLNTTLFNCQPKSSDNSVISDTSSNSKSVISHSDNITKNPNQISVCIKTPVISEGSEDEEDVLNKTYTVSKDKDISIFSDKESRVEDITDYILNELLNECVTNDKVKRDTLSTNNNQAPDIVALKENSTWQDNSVDNFTQTVINKFLEDATDCMLNIKESRKSTQIDLNQGFRQVEGITSPNKLIDALALEGSKPLLDRGQSEKFKNSVLKAGEKIIQEIKYEESNDCELSWFDDDLHPVSLQAQREAEELRLKQLQIEQEIEQLEQAQENIPSYYYVREIPNKPPPPYTPPQAQPTRQEDIETLTSIAVHSLLAAWRRGEDITMLQPTEQYSAKHVGCQVYKKFMFDLVKQIFFDVTVKDSGEKESSPWEQRGCRIRHLVLPKLTDDSLKSFILRKVRVLFGFELSSMKENLIIQWSRKKRDRVDELLMRESQEEEQEWIDYSKYEVGIKNDVALNIFKGLLEETSLVVSKALQRKLSYTTQNL